VQRAAVVVLVLVVTGLSMVWLFQRRLIYLPSTSPVPSAESVIPGAQDVVLHTSDGLDLGAWFVPADPPDANVTVLVANGNAGDRSVRAPLARALAAEGLSVLLFDYRGYGGNPGSPSETGLARDVRAARSFLVDDLDVPPDRLIYFGESLGTGVVTELATQEPPAGLVLRSPYTDLAALGQEHYPWLPVQLLLRDRYPQLKRIDDVTAPVVVVYGDADTIVPPGQSKAVAQAVRELSDEVEVAGAGHNDPALLNGDLLLDAVVRLADRVRRSGR
jgi:uncharacterized protein